MQQQLPGENKQFTGVGREIQMPEQDKNSTKREEQNEEDKE